MFTLQQAHSVIIYISYQLQTGHSNPSIINFFIALQIMPHFSSAVSEPKSFLSAKNPAINANYL